MLLTIITFAYIYYCIKFLKGEGKIKYFPPVTIFIIGTHILAIIPMNYVLAWFFWAIFIIILIYQFEKGDPLEVIPSKKVVTVLIVFLVIISLYTQFFNGIEGFIEKPGDYFLYAKTITPRYIFVPPKIIRNDSSSDYVYSFIQYKNAFYLPESLTRIGFYKGKVYYKWAYWSHGKVPVYYRRYFWNNKFIDSVTWLDSYDNIEISFCRWKIDEKLTPLEEWVSAFLIQYNF